MTDPTSLSLEEVLDMLLDEFDTPSGDAIAAYSQRYPHFRADLLRFGATWAEEAFLPEPSPLSASHEEALDARGQSFLHNALYERASSVASSVTPTVSDAAPVSRETLAQLARQAGHALHDVARDVGLSLPLMSELNARGFRPDTITGTVARRLSQRLGIGVDRVLASWTGPPVIQPTMAFLATVKPQIPPQRDFRAAVRESDLSPEEQAALLEED